MGKRKAGTFAEKRVDLERPLPNGCVLWEGPRTIYHDGAYARVARLVWEEERGLLTEGTRLVRTCGTGGCVLAAHHAVVPIAGGDRRAGRIGRLSPEETQRLVARWENGEQVAALAREFGVSRTAIYTRVRYRDRVRPVSSNVRAWPVRQRAILALADAGFGPDQIAGVIHARAGMVEKVLALPRPDSPAPSGGRCSS